MHIVVVGSGGVGGYFGAKLAKAGEHVTFLARGAHLRAMRENGLLVRSAQEGEWRVDAHAVDTLEGQAQADLVLFCVKSYDTEEVAEIIRPVLGAGSAILSLQNGIDNEEKLGRAFTAEQVLGGVAYVFSHIEAPGIIAHQQLGRIVFGEMGGAIPGRARALADALTRASIPNEISNNIRKTLWEKYIFLTALAGTTALARLPVHFIRTIPETRRLWQRQVEELLALAQSDGAGLDDDMLDRCVAFLESLAPSTYSSLYHDLIQGKRLELDALHGHALRLGLRDNIPTPMLFAVYAALRGHQAGMPAFPTGILA